MHGEGSTPNLLLRSFVVQISIGVMQGYVQEMEAVNATTTVMDMPLDVVLGTAIHVRSVFVIVLPN